MIVDVERAFWSNLTQRGASYVLGLDLGEPMIRAARELQPSRNEYRIADVEFVFSADQSFDLVVSYLNQCDLPDFKLTREKHIEFSEMKDDSLSPITPDDSAGEGYNKMGLNNT